MVDIEDLIAAGDNQNKPTIIEALLSTVDTIFTNNRMLQRSRLTARHIRGITRVIGMQSFLRARLSPRTYKPFLDEETGEFTYQKFDNRVLTAIAEAVLAGRISLEGKSRDEIIRIFQAVGGTATESSEDHHRILGRFDY